MKLYNNAIVVQPDVFSKQRSNYLNNPCEKNECNENNACIKKKSEYKLISTDH